MDWSAMGDVGLGSDSGGYSRKTKEQRLRSIENDVNEIRWQTTGCLVWVALPLTASLAVIL